MQVHSDRFLTLIHCLVQGIYIYIYIYRTQIATSCVFYLKRRLQCVSVDTVVFQSLKQGWCARYTQLDVQSSIIIIS